MKNTFALPIKHYKGKLKFVRSHCPSGRLPGWGKLIELCTSPASNLGRVALEFDKRVSVDRVTQREELGKSSFVRLLHDQ
eukprot:9877139-Karenia_brevis.AAC.1